MDALPDKSTVMSPYVAQIDAKTMVDAHGAVSDVFMCSDAPSTPEGGLAYV